MSGGMEWGMGWQDGTCTDGIGCSGGGRGMVASDARIIITV